MRDCGPAHYAGCACSEIAWQAKYDAQAKLAEQMIDEKRALEARVADGVASYEDMRHSWCEEYEKVLAMEAERDEWRRKAELAESWFQTSQAAVGAATFERDALEAKVAAMEKVVGMSKVVAARMKKMTDAVDCDCPPEGHLCGLLEARTELETLEFFYEKLDALNGGGK